MHSASYVVEGQIDNAVLLKLLKYVNIIPGPARIYGGDRNWHSRPRTIRIGGRDTTLQQHEGGPLVLEVIEKANIEARHKRWIALTDLDNKFACAGLARQHWLPNPAPYMCFRIAVQEIEAWLLADREAIADFLKVDIAEVPKDPNNVSDPADNNKQLMPKEVLVMLAGKSKASSIRAKVNSLSSYNNLLGEFARNHWRPAIAAQHSPSLEKCLRKLQKLARGQKVN